MIPRLIIITFGWWLATGLQSADLQLFLKNYCVQCHGPDKQKGDRRFDQLTGDFTQLAEAEAFQEILDQLNLAKCRPKENHGPIPPTSSY